MDEAGVYKEVEDSSEMDELKKQLQEKSLELNKEIALRKLLNSQKDDQTKRLRAAEQQLEKLTTASSTTSRSTSTAPSSTTHSLSQRSSEAAGPATVGGQLNEEAGEERSNEEAGQQPLLGLLREAEERNADLTARLHESETEVGRLKLAQLRLDTANSARVAAQSADLMKRLSSMQREREKVLTTQLKVALKERQEALERAGTLVKGQDVAKLAENSELSQLISEMREAKDADELKHHGAILVAKMKAMKDERDAKIRARLQTLLSEKEAAEERVTALVLDVARLQRRLEVAETEYKLVDKTRIKALQAQLEATLQEKEMWQERSNKFEDQIETLRILNSLQKSLKKEEQVKRAYELELQRSRAEIEALRHTVEEMVVERNMAIVERNQIARERNELAENARLEFERAEQLQRIVVVLRKKARNASISSDNSLNT